MKFTTFCTSARKWLHRVTEGETVHPTYRATVIAEPNQAGTFSWVAVLGSETVKSCTGYSSEAAAKAAGVTWVRSLGHVVGVR